LNNRSSYSKDDKNIPSFDTYFYFSETEEFLEWIKLKVGQEHFVHISSYFKRHLANKKFKGPLEMYKYISEQKGGNNLIKAARGYLNYCEAMSKLSPEIIETYRKVLKLKRSRTDYHVPSDEEVINNYNLIKGNKNLELVYLVLACSGLRYIEVLRFLKSYDKSKFVDHGDFVSYNISEIRGSKSVNNLYLPKFVYDKLKHVDNTYNSLRQRFKEKGLTFTLKYLRKWNYNFLIYNGVPESVADFIQGRSSSSVSANHYLAKSQQANHWCHKIISSYPFSK
jgi:intergrase/recombinase